MKLKPLLLLMVLAVVLAGSSLLHAWRLGTVKVEEAIANGNIAFTGKIIALEETEVQRRRIMAVAHIKILECHYGIDCRTNKTVQLRYVNHDAHDLENIAADVDFRLSQKVLIILKSKNTAPVLTFDSCPYDGTDYAYIYMLDIPFTDYAQKDPITLFYIFYGNTSETVSADNFNTWIKKRAGELQKKQ